MFAQCAKSLLIICVLMLALCATTEAKQVNLQHGKTVLELMLADQCSPNLLGPIVRASGLSGKNLNSLADETPVIIPDDCATVQPSAQDRLESQQLFAQEAKPIQPQASTKKTQEVDASASASAVVIALNEQLGQQSARIQKLESENSQLKKLSPAPAASETGKQKTSSDRTTADRESAKPLQRTTGHPWLWSLLGLALGIILTTMVVRLWILQRCMTMIKLERKKKMNALAQVQNGCQEIQHLAREILVCNHKNFCLTESALRDKERFNQKIAKLEGELLVARDGLAELQSGAGRIPFNAGGTLPSIVVEYQGQQSNFGIGSLSCPKCPEERIPPTLNNARQHLGRHGKIFSQGPDIAAA